jgi:hypothetical protein
MEKYIFLDIDGVLNTRKSIELPMLDDKNHRFDPACVEALNNIIEETDAKIVITSSWRNNLGSDEANLNWIRNIFYVRGFNFPHSIIGQTVRGYKYTIKGSNLPIVRGNEIKQWTDTHLRYPWHAYPERSEEYTIRDEDGNFKKMRSNELGVDYRYVIIDDDNDMLLEHYDLFYQTEFENGLTSNTAKYIIEYLNKDENGIN